MEISTIVSKIKLQQLQLEGKKPVVHVILTFDDKTTRYAIPNDVTNSYAYRYDEFKNEKNMGDESYCVGLAEVMEYFQAGKLIVARE